MSEHLLLGLVCIIVFGIGAQWIAWKTKLPAILLLLISGLIAGPFTGILNPDQLMGDLLMPFVSLSVAIILFEGGLSLRFSELREIGGVVVKLVSVGVLVTWIITSVSSFYIFGFSWKLAILLGAILVVTGPTVIIPLLRQVRPTGQVGSVLKWEGIVIDPIGAMLAVLVFEVLISSGANAASLAVTSILKTVVFGTLVGLLGAIAIYMLLKRHLLPDYLQNPVNLMIVVSVFALSNVLQHESGLWATTVMGIALANQKTARIQHIVEFKENLRVLLLSALFILLAARVEMSQITAALNWQMLAFLIVLILVARPLGVFLSTIGSSLNLKEKVFLSWMAPRGVVAASIASIFALALTETGFTEAEQLVPIVILTIIATVAIYGLPANWVACKLNVAKPIPRGVLFLGAHTWAREVARVLKDFDFKVMMADSNWDNISKARKYELDTYYGNILSEYALDDINLDGIGRLLALTPNDEVNSLAIIRFAEIFGTSEVFQLAPVTQSRRKEREVPDYLSGRILFDERMTFERLETMFEMGAELSSFEVKDDYGLSDFKEEHERRCLPLFIVNQQHELRIYSVDHPPSPVVGDHVICLLVPQAFDKKESAARTAEVE
jgi:NhaP-type Na+/H+ or K+/H+ antiporter